MERNSPPTARSDQLPSPDPAALVIPIFPSFKNLFKIFKISVILGLKGKQTSPTPDYPSSVSAARFGEIKPILESISKNTRPLEVDLHAVFNAVLYVLREGCRWRALPRDFPKWNTVYYHFRKWKNHTDRATGLPVLELVQKKTGAG